jgi:hypothetical protein
LTLAGSLSALLSSEWSLAGTLAAASVAFSTDWYNSGLLTPQVIVTPLASPVGGFFGTVNLTLHHRFRVNCWLQIPAGADGEAEKVTIESMREEVLRIVNAKRHSIASFANMVPLDEGTPLHEMDGTPRILRYEMVVFAVENHP